MPACAGSLGLRPIWTRPARPSGEFFAMENEQAKSSAEFELWPGKTPPQKDWFDLNGAIEEVIAMVKSAVKRNGVSLHTNLGTDLPPVMGDRIQLQQVVLNLVINAIEEMSRADEGSRELWLSSEKVTETICASEVCAAPAEGTHVLVTVRDTGPGLDPGVLDSVFDAFYTTKPQGLGLGLTICRSIVEAHQGRLWATSNASGGAIFRFTLPV
jgi:signal transduction histidine kinase